MVNVKLYFLFTLCYLAVAIHLLLGGGNFEGTSFIAHIFYGRIDM